MKITFALLCAAALLAAPALAQEVSPPLPEAGDEPLVMPDEPTLIPDEPMLEYPVYVPDEPLFDEPSDTRPEPTFSKTQASIEEMKNRVKMREARTKAARDPAVLEAKAQAAAAKTFPAKREALGLYYDRLFMRMKKIDKSIEQRVDAAQAAYRRRLLQPRINPEDAAIINAAEAAAAAQQQ